MKKPYRLRWEPKFFIRAIIFGILFLAFQLVLNYLKRDKIMEYDMVVWNSFFTLAMTYCAYVAQIVYSDFKELNPDKAGNGKYIAHRITKYFPPPYRTVCRLLIFRSTDCDGDSSLQRDHVRCSGVMRVSGD